MNLELATHCLAETFEEIRESRLFGWEAEIRTRRRFLTRRLTSKDELNAYAVRQEQLEAQLADTEEPPPLLTRRWPGIYRAKVTDLAAA